MYMDGSMKMSISGNANQSSQVYGSYGLSQQREVQQPQEFSRI